MATKTDPAKTLDKKPARDWEALATDEKRVLLSQMEASALAVQYGRPEEFFNHAQTFFEQIPKNKEEHRKTHNPPKDLIVSARRDLSFYEANFELVDNSIDEWRRRGGKKTLNIKIDYELDTMTGVYQDDAGGMDERSVFRVFIPGESSNREYSQRVIGSFGLGAKKGIFRLTNGARVVSSPDGKISYTSEVPENWEATTEWETTDGNAEPIPAGQTRLYFFKLVLPPTQAEITDLVKKAGVVYAPILSGELGNLAGEPKGDLKIVINGAEVKAVPDIMWASPDGAEPHTYELSKEFANPLNPAQPIHLRFIFRCGLLMQRAGVEGKERDFGFDAYGNGRLIQEHLKDEFGFGIKGMSKQTSAASYVRGKLFIVGHSVGIPWDTHKREYLADQPVSLWLKQALKPVVRAYMSTANKFAEVGRKEARKDLEKTPFEPAKAKATIKLPAGTIPDKEEHWPKLANALKKDADDAKKKKKEEDAKAKGKPASPKPPTPKDDDVDGPEADVEEGPQDEFVVSLKLDSEQYEELCDRAEVTSPDELETLLPDRILNSVWFQLSEEEFAQALKRMKCIDAVDLSARIKESLVKKL